MLKEVTEVYTTEKSELSTVYTTAIGDEVKFYRIPALTDANFINSPLSHLWSNLSLRTEVDFNESNLSYNYGGLLGTALNYLPIAFYSGGCIGFSVNNSNYRVQLDGSNIAFQIPLNSAYSGMTSGLTATTLYSSYVYNPEYLIKNPYNLCDGVTFDSVRSEPSPIVTDNVGIGFQYIEGKNPDMNPKSNYKFYDSGVVYLVTNDVYNTFSGATGSSTSWGYLWNQNQKYANGAKTISFNPSITTYSGVGGYDRIVGAMFLNSGFGFIWDPELVNGLDWSTINGDPTTITGATFTSGQTAFNSADWDFSEILNVKIIMDRKDWRASSNSSYIGTGEDCGIASTAITLHDDMGMCLGVVKTDDALIKEYDKYVILDLELPLSEPIQTSLADTRGLIWP